MQTKDEQLARLRSIFSEGSFRVHLEESFAAGLHVTICDPYEPLTDVTTDDLSDLFRETELDATGRAENGIIDLWHD